VAASSLLKYDADDEDELFLVADSIFVDWRSDPPPPPPPLALLELITLLFVAVAACVVVEELDEEGPLVVDLLEGGTSFVLELRSCDDLFEWEDRVTGAVERGVFVEVPDEALCPEPIEPIATCWVEFAIDEVEEDDDDDDDDDDDCAVWCTLDGFFDIFLLLLWEGKIRFLQKI
jgi:hypothetical protein